MPCSCMALKVCGATWLRTCHPIRAASVALRHQAFPFFEIAKILDAHVTAEKNSSIGDGVTLPERRTMRMLWSLHVRSKCTFAHGAGINAIQLRESRDGKSTLDTECQTFTYISPEVRTPSSLFAPTPDAPALGEQVCPRRDRCGCGVRELQILLVHHGSAVRGELDWSRDPVMRLRVELPQNASKQARAPENNSIAFQKRLAKHISDTQTLEHRKRNSHPQGDPRELVP